MFLAFYVLSGIIIDSCHAFLKIYVSEGVDMSAPISNDSDSISSVPSHETSASTRVECRRGRGRMGRPRLRERLPVVTPDVASSQRCSYGVVIYVLVFLMIFFIY